MHLEPTRAAIEAFQAADIPGPVTMLNLLRFRERADYARSPDLAPPEDVSGADAYRTYQRAVTPLLERVGGELVETATGGPVLVGPDDEHWDLVLLVRYPDVAAFTALTTDPDYLAVVGHRTAALADSRLVPLQAPEPARFHDRDLRGAEFRAVDLSEATFRGVRFTGATMRDVDLDQVTIDADLTGTVVNEVEIAPLVEAELDRRDPDRVAMRPTDPDGFRTAWDVLERRWNTTVDRARRLDPELLHVSVDGEWSFVQTLRHLAYATDTWLRRVILGDPRPWHPLSLPFDELRPHPEVPWDREAEPTLDEALALREDRRDQVRRYLDTLDDATLASHTEPVDGPSWPPPDRYPVRECLLILLNEEWNHRRYAERDLDMLESRPRPSTEAARPGEAPWLPEDFVAPERVPLLDGRFHLRPISPDDTDLDMVAVMGSQERLWAIYGDAWGWPPADMTAEQDRADLARHADEMSRSESFNYALFDRDESALLGCCYIDPPEQQGTDAEVSWWVVDDLVGSDVEAALDDLVPRWIAADWPLDRPHYPFRRG